MKKDPVCGMDVNETHGVRLEQDGRTDYFCSQHCLNKFVKEKNIDVKKAVYCAPEKKKAWYKNKTFIVSAVLLLASLLSYVFPFLIPFRQSLFMYFKIIWWAVLLGLLLGGVIDYFVPREYISKILASRNKRTIFHAVILGFFMSVCSHGILALSIQLYKKGASTSSVVTFLLASPWANFPLTIMFIGFFGLIKALYIVLCAIIIAVVTGFIYQLLESKNIVEINKNSLATAVDFSIIEDFKRRTRNYRFTIGQITQDLKGIRDGVVSLADMVLWWILIGMGLASLAGAYIPENIFHQYMGPTILGMLVTLLVATVLEVCSEGTSPLAFEIFRQTGALGNSFVFLMAGVATDYTEIGLLWHNIGKKTAIWLPIITVPQIIFWGIIANIVFGT
ncbi:MAG: permease [Candidatus Omnitrophota bacterium]